MPTGMAYSVALDGVTGRVVAIEADLHDGVPAWSLTGLPDTCVAEARDRCRSAMVNTGERWPDRRITVAMYPADVRKVGTHYDLAIALALLVAKRSVPGVGLRKTAVFGELVLDGRLRPVPGVLPAALAAAAAGLDRVIVPTGNVAEARLVPGLDVVGVASLRACMAVLSGVEPPPEPDYAPLHDDEVTAVKPPSALDFADLADVRGQAEARWCIEVAAAGGHHLFLEGPPGSGKTMLAERFPMLLPDLDLGQSIEVSQIHSVAGLLSRDHPLVIRPPYVAPHHNDTVPSVVGGGSRLIRPGAISLAHLGVLFMDEAPEFKPTVHDALRQPLESGRISIRRADDAAEFPARFQLILAANPCECHGGTESGDHCTCPPSKRRRYHDRISGPVRDRIDMIHFVQPSTPVQMRQEVGLGGTTAAVAARVLEARSRARARFVDTPWRTNCDVPGFEFRRLCPLDPDCASEIENLVAHGKLTQRGADRVARLAWTLADLGGFQAPRRSHARQALSLRTGGVHGDRILARQIAS